MNARVKQFPPEVEAAVHAWLELRDQGKFVGKKEEEFIAWVDADPVHLEAFQAYEPIWSRLDRLREPEPVVARPEPRVRRTSVWAWTVPLAAAAALMVGYFVVRPMPVERPATASEFAFTAGTEPKTEHLTDGSLVKLAPGAKVSVDFSGTERRLALTAGTAHFAVAKNPSRPFIVSANGVDVRAVGTAFDVSLALAAVEVVVTEGKVRVDDSSRGTTLLPVGTPIAENFAAPVLEAGQKVSIDTGSGAPKVAMEIVTLAPIAVAAGPELPATLQFDGTPLEQVVAAFNVRNAHQLVIVDERLKQQAFTGTLRADNYASLARMLRESFGVDVEEQGERTLLRMSADGNEAR